MVLHFRLASSVSVSEKLIFYKSRFGYLQPHLKHATAYLLLIFLIITMGLEASQNMSCFESAKEGKSQLWASLRGVQ